MFQGSRLGSIHEKILSPHRKKSKGPFMSPLAAIFGMVSYSAKVNNAVLGAVEAAEAYLTEKPAAGMMQKTG
jgi:hypothetical protein